MFELRDKLNALGMGRFEMIGSGITVETQRAYGLGLPANLSADDAEILWCGQYILWFDGCSQVLFADIDAVVRYFMAWRAEGDMPAFAVEGCEIPEYENGGK